MKPNTLLLVITTLFSFVANGQSLSDQKNYFYPNKGQVKDQHQKAVEEVKFIMNNAQMNISLRAKGFSYDTFMEEKSPVFDESDMIAEPGVYSFHRIDIELKGINEDFEIVQFGKSKSYENYYTGNTNGINYVCGFSKVVYKEIYPNIDLEFVTSNDKPFEYNFILHPGAQPDDIQLIYKGSNDISLNPKGNIEILIDGGKIEESIPLSYWKKSGKKVEIKYAQPKKVKEGYLIKLKGLESSKEDVLIVDPVPILEWKTYYGGNDDDLLLDIEKNSNNELIVSGFTQSTSNIATAGSHQTTIGGIFDGFFAKFDNSGNRVWSTYYGGNTVSFILDMKVNNQNEIYICGGTESANSIATTGAHQENNGGGTDGFIAKFDNDGQLLWGSYYGGNNEEEISSITIDSNDDIIFVGVTSSTNQISTIGASQENLSGGEDAFIVKMNANGVRQWATYLGGNNDDKSGEVITNATNDIIITGTTNSTTNLSTVGSYQENLSGQFDAFLGKYQSNGQIDWLSYFGGNNSESNSKVQINQNNEIILTGNSGSLNNITSTGALIEDLPQNLSSDAYLAIFDDTGNWLYGTYLGLAGSVDNFKINNGNLFLVGQLDISNTLPLPGAYQQSINGTNSGYWIQIEDDGTPINGSFHSGDVNDPSYSTSVKDGVFVGDSLYLTGWTSFPNSFVSSGSVFQPNFGGGLRDGFLSLITFCNVDATVSVTDHTITANESGATYQWMDCDTGQPISGETGQSYTATYNGNFSCEITNASCTTNSLCTEITTVGISEFQNQNIHVYPNPAKDHLWIEFNESNQGAVSIEMYDVSGQSVYSDQINNQKAKIKIDALSSGQYILKAHSDTKVMGVMKIIVE